KRDLVNTKVLVPVRASGTESLGFVIKTATLTRKVDGWYVTLSLQAPSVPELNPDTPAWENTIGIDLGLDDFLVTDSGESVKVPRHYRRTEKKLKRLQKAISRQKKRSNRYKKAVKRLAKVHQKLANQRRDFHHKTAHKLVQTRKHIAHEALNIKGLARTRLAKSVHDAGWGQFLQILAAKAERAGLLTIAVDPRGSSQECSGCGRDVPKKLDERWHDCPHCGLSIGRDQNSALIIKSRAVGRPVLKAQEMSCYRAGVTVREAGRSP
ncbi:RNA-guided endonuclease InsQ/TnpB family protein, partial [Synechococcus sp. H55.11]